MKQYSSRKVTTAIVCTVGFLFGIPFIYNGGYYLFELVDGVATLISTFVTLFLEAFLASIYILNNKVGILVVNNLKN